MYKTVVYISHPYGGRNNNEKIVADLINSLIEKFPDYLFVSPVHAFSFAYHTVEYQQGLNMCLWLLEQCDEVWVFGDYQYSVGCMAEIAYCQNHRIYYQIINDNCLNIVHQPRKCCDCGLMELNETWATCNKNIVSALYEKARSKYDEKRKETIVRPDMQ